MPCPFPTDRRSIIRCVRAFVSLLAERLKDDRDVALPNGLTMNNVMFGLAAYEADWEATVRSFQLADDEAEPEWFEEIADTLREVFDDLAEPGPGEASRN